jgi:hypothetical protein
MAFPTISGRTKRVVALMRLERAHRTKTMHGDRVGMKIAVTMFMVDELGSRWNEALKAVQGLLGGTRHKGRPGTLGWVANLLRDVPPGAGIRQRQESGRQCLGILLVVTFGPA